jgi:hypothetical protein
MGQITPLYSNSQALITPGWPMASVVKSNPISPAELQVGPNNGPGSQTNEPTVRQKALVQAGLENTGVI